MFKQGLKRQNPVQETAGFGSIFIPIEIPCETAAS
jgi:hypothetical protein